MSLKYVAAYLMSSLSGVEHPGSSDIEGILNAIGASVDADIVNKLISEMSGKDINEVIASGMSKLQSIPSGGSVQAAQSSTKPSEAAAAEEEKPEEEPEEEEEEDDMGFSLFD